MIERVIELPEKATIAEAGTLANTLSEAIVEPGPYVMRGGKIGRIDAAGLQALASFWLTATALGWDARWEGVSDTLKTAATATGMTHILGLQGQG